MWRFGLVSGCMPIRDLRREGSGAGWTGHLSAFDVADS
jgi:hypothetical protein